ncbi:MAG: class I lanthipeptide [Thermoanaerobaculia bacterium]
MKKHLKKVKKLTLDKETLARLNVVGGLYAAQKEATEPASGGPDICYFSDCNPCDTVMQCGTYTY